MLCKRHRWVLQHFCPVYFFYCWDEFMNYILKLVFSIMLPFKMLINNNNGGLGGCTKLKYKFILTQPSPQNPFLVLT